VSNDVGDDRDEPSILHCFADYGVESEILSWYGDVVRIGIDALDTNESEPITADANILEEGKDWDIPFKDDVTFDLGVFHPVCSKWASTTSISGDPDDHTNMIPSARSIADRYCDHYVIENVPRAPLEDPIVLDGRMFGLPIKYERAFETSFDVPQPPRYKRFWGKDRENDTAETSSFFFTERSRRWWASVKGVPPRKYPKQHLAKNTIPGPYIHHVCRAWLRVFKEDNDIDYSDYDQRMETQRRQDANRSLADFASGSDKRRDAELGEVLPSFEEEEDD
jgi:hypothetical protein